MKKELTKLLNKIKDLKDRGYEDRAILNLVATELWALINK